MKNKKLLVIGAGIAQVDAIQRAKDLGYYVLASDGSSLAPGLKVAHESRVIDVKDIIGNMAWARKAKIDGVISYASDVTLSAVEAVREALGLPGLGKIPMGVSLDKAQQRMRFKAAGLAQPNFEIVDSLIQMRQAVNRLGFPVVVKPVDNSGSRGVTILEEESFLEKTYQEAKGNSNSGRVIVEEFMDGIELTVEGFSIGGQHHILAISDKYKPEGVYCVATQLAYPAEISIDDEMKVTDLIKAAYNAAQVDNTPTHSEVILTSQGPKIVEMACRGGGFYVFTRVVEMVSGYDIVGNWSKLCAGDSPEEVKVLKRGVVLRFYSAPIGRLVGVAGFEQARAIPGVETDLFIKPGEMIPELKTDGSRTGWMIVSGKDRHDAVRKADQVCNLVKFQVEE
jgi:biotin carboxylase